MKIGILLWELDISGGTQRQALSLARELQDLGDDVTVYCLRTDEGRCFKDLMRQVPVRAFESEGLRKGGENPLPKLLRRWTGQDAVTDLLRRLAENIPSDLDLLNVHDYVVYPAACFWKMRTGKPVVWMMNDLPGEMAFRNKGESPWKTFERYFNGKVREGVRLRSYAEAMDKIVVLDRRNRDLVARVIGTEAEVVRSGLDLVAYPWTPRVPPEVTRPLRLLSNAIFFPHRRIEDIVRALAVLRERGVPFEWTHVGPDSRDRKYAEQIYAEVERQELNPFVVFAGEVPEERLVSCFQTADIFLYPNAPQTWGLAVFQAMACGTPAIVSRGAGASEVLTHGENALLVDACSPLRLADAIQELRDDSALWARLHVEGRRFVERNIRWDLYAAEMRRIFSGLTEARS